MNVLERAAHQPRVSVKCRFGIRCDHVPNGNVVQVADCARFAVPGIDFDQRFTRVPVAGGGFRHAANTRQPFAARQITPCRQPFVQMSSMVISQMSNSARVCAGTQALGSIGYRSLPLGESCAVDPASAVHATAASAEVPRIWRITQRRHPDRRSIPTPFLPCISSVMSVIRPLMQRSKLSGRSNAMPDTSNPSQFDRQTASVRQPPIPRPFPAFRISPGEPPAHGAPSRRCAPRSAR